MNPLEFPGLQIESPLISPQAQNFRPPTWPPPDDFPVMIDAAGVVVSRYRDPSWNLAPWDGRPLRLAFGDNGNRRGVKVSAGNAALLRQIDAWWLWGPSAARKATTLASRHKRLKPLFVICTEAGILASELSRFPMVLEKVAKGLTKGNANQAFAILHDLWTVRKIIGFELLDELALKRLGELLPANDPTQTAYIPPRIWTEQVLRLRECLDDYLANRHKVQACYRFCIDAYATNAGGAERMFDRLPRGHKPFEPTILAGETREGRSHYGRFRLTAERFGIDSLLDRWVVFNDKNGLRALSSYLTLISQVGLAYALNFSLMRIDEGMQLRVNCHSVERDSLGDDIHTLSSATSKTIQDDDARWIVSPSVESAIGAMVSVARLRGEATRQHQNQKSRQTECAGVILQPRSDEPWWDKRSKTFELRKKYRSYAEILETYPKLFDKEKLRITESDLSFARCMTFGLDPEKFAVGEIWPLSWHQLRRTGACNMLSSGLVSEASLQYQLKHLTRAMSRYYGQNHYKLMGRLEDDARGYYLREMYQSLTREFLALQGVRYISPHGEKRKAQILAPISDKDHKALVRDAETGRISYRETFLGGCAKPGAACPLGGVSNISGCMGHGDYGACEWVLIDQRKRPVVEKLRGIFLTQLRTATPGSRQRESLQANIESAERAIHVIDTV